MELLREVDEYEQLLKAAENEMKGSQSAFMITHGTTMEVLEVAGQVGLSGQRDIVGKDHEGINVYFV